MGMFSWFTSDTNERIVADKTKDIYMTGKDGRVFHLEEPYEGYGVFGGKDFYEYLAELNDLPSNRNQGIDLFFSSESIEGPRLFTNKGSIKDWDIYDIPKEDPDQGFPDEWLDDEED